MVDITATGWNPSNVEVLRTERPWGAIGGKEALVKLKFFTDDHVGARFYPSNGIPMPGPSLVGLSRISYVIPVCPLVDVRGQTTAPVAATTVAQSRAFAWGVYHPTYGASGVTSTRGSFSMRIVGGVPLVTGSGATHAGGDPSFARKSFTAQLTTNIAASNISPTSAAGYRVAYAVFGEF